MTSQMSNEQLCIAALDGDTEARNALVENNLRFIKRTAYEMWSAQRELNAALGIEINDLVQEGSLGLLDCIPGYDPDTGNKFLTYAAPAIRNAMVDYIRRWNPTFEAKNLGSIVRLDDVVKDENKGRHEFIADSRVKNPEQIYIAKETHEEIHTALQRIDRRERAYLWYRFGFEDDIYHPLNETAKHFHLSESRARSTEALALDNVWLELPWWY
ncbi:sigma-70 family RNA polymerase sigma factor [Anaerotignum sp.]